MYILILIGKIKMLFPKGELFTFPHSARQRPTQAHLHKYNYTMDMRRKGNA
uniref:Uncharacterized protein n=1 Tax=Anguilla anguilla TaxID=7936 RepID=A0A0E9UAK1_ANGAN